MSVIKSRKQKDFTAYYCGAKGLIFMAKLYPMLAVTGTPTREKLQSIMKSYKEIGIEGIMIYPRSGCEVEYMSEQWREVCAACIEYAAENNMKVWLYDEFNWPSGSCDNQVQLEDINNCRKCFLVQKDTVTVTSFGWKWDAQKEKIKPAAADLLNPTSVETFIRLTHERYFKWFGKYFGSVIPGIFTDEPSFKHPPHTADEYPYTYPYYDGVIEDYKAACGRDLIADILAYDRGERDNDFWGVFYKIISERFERTYIKPIGQWCEKHGIAYTGHMVCDDDIRGTVLSTGDIFSVLGDMQIPGIDEIYTDIKNDDPLLNTDFSFAQLQNLRENGKSGAMAELYALGPDTLSAAERAREIWYAAAHGVTHFFGVVSHLDAKGNFERSEYFINHSPDAPNVGILSYLKEQAELSEIYANKEFAATVSIRYPLSEVRRQLGHNFEFDYTELVKETLLSLADAQIPWRLIREDELSKTRFTVSFKNGRPVLNDEKMFKNIEELMETLLEKCKPSVTVAELSGESAKDIFVKTFQDGSYIVIDRAVNQHKARTLVINANGEKRIVELPCFGVITDSDSDTAFKLPQGNAINIGNVSVKFNAPRVKRLNMLSGGGCTIKVAEDETLYLQFNVRTYPEEAPLYIDGKPVETPLAADNLSDTFNGLYKKTEPIKLTKGKHIISMPAVDKLFLPSVIAEGDFCEKDGELYPSERMIPAEGEHEFFGTASLVFSAELPQNTEVYAELDNCFMMCELYINGEKTEMISAAPYAFKVPDKYLGKSARFELRFHSSAAPLFGDTVKYDKEIDDLRADWVKVIRTSQPEKIGLFGLRLVAKD